MNKKLEISKKGDQWITHSLKTGRLIGTITQQQALDHWENGDAVFVGEAMNAMARAALTTNPTDQ